MWLATSIQSALFDAMLKFVYDIGSWIGPNFENNLNEMISLQSK